MKTIKKSNFKSFEGIVEKHSKKYRIKIDYNTGNSEHTERTDEYIELEWDDYNVAKENLRAIKQHYTELYVIIENSYSIQKNNQIVCKKMAKYPWFVEFMKLYCISKDNAIDETKKKKYPNDTEYRFDIDKACGYIRLKTDDGMYMQMHCFWCGYFETLHGAEIVSDDSSFFL